MYFVFQDTSKKIESTIIFSCQLLSVMLWPLRTDTWLYEKSVSDQTFRDLFFSVEKCNMLKILVFSGKWLLRRPNGLKAEEKHFNIERADGKKIKKILVIDLQIQPNTAANWSDYLLLCGRHKDLPVGHVFNGKHYHCAGVDNGSLLSTRA